MGHDDLIGLGQLGEVLQEAADVRTRADAGVLHHVGDTAALARGEERIDLLIGVLGCRRPACDEHPHPDPTQRLEVPRRLVGVLGGDNVRARDHVGLRQLSRGLELAAIERHRLLQRIGREVRRKGVGEPERSGQLSAEQ